MSIRREPFQARGRFIWAGSSEHDAIMGEVYDNGQPYPEEMAQIWAASYCTMFPALAQIRDAAAVAMHAAPNEWTPEAVAVLLRIHKLAADALPVPTIGDVNGTSPPPPALRPSADVPVREALDLREAVAKALHDHEGEDWTWPTHEDDDGYRGNGGYVRITPPDVRERYRDRADVALGAIPHAAVTRAVNEALFARCGDAWNYDMDAAKEAARKDAPVIVAVPSKSRGAPIVGEAYYDPNAYGGTWWWGTTSEKDWGASCIEDGNDGPPFAWQPMPTAPQQEAFQPQQDEGRTEAAL